MQVLRRLEGAYALLITSSHFPGELVATRRGSPLMFGVRNSRSADRRRFRALADLQGDCFGDSALECFIASDDKALIEHTRVRAPHSLLRCENSWLCSW
jgi:glutamine---fructose-6-phosphate transaminase (isomerizing)